MPAAGRFLGRCRPRGGNVPGTPRKHKARDSPVVGGRHERKIDVCAGNPPGKFPRRNAPSIKKGGTPKDQAGQGLRKKRGKTTSGLRKHQGLANRGAQRFTIRFTTSPKPSSARSNDRRPATQHHANPPNFPASIRPPKPSFKGGKRSSKAPRAKQVRVRV